MLQINANYLTVNDDTISSVTTLSESHIKINCSIAEPKKVKSIIDEQRSLSIVIIMKHYEAHDEKKNKIFKNRRMKAKTVLIAYYSRRLRDRCNLQELFCERWDSRPEQCTSR